MSDESPSDRFKSVLAGASRAIAHEKEIEVNWTADAPSASGGTFRLPMPGRSLPRGAAMQARGYADSFALKVRHHNDKLHMRKAPSEPSARACYDAVEAVRYEALGANAYPGMRENLDASLMARMASDPIMRAETPDQVPVQSALALMLREKLTGQPIPEAAQAGVDMVRSWIEEKAGGDFDALAQSIQDQNAFQTLSLDMLQHLELTRPEDIEQPPDEPDDQDGDEETEEEQDGDDAGQEQQPSEMSAEPSQGEDEGESESEGEASDEMEDGQEGDEGEEGMMPVRPNRPWTDIPDGFDYKVFTEAFVEVTAAAELCDDEGHVTEPPEIVAAVMRCPYATGASWRLLCPVFPYG